MDLADALRNAFPDHEPEETVGSSEEKSFHFYVILPLRYNVAMRSAKERLPQ